MEPNAILNADPLDLLFDNRNKSYGAYPLRKYYDRRLMTALALSLTGGALFFFLITLGPEPMMVTEVSIPPDFVLPTAIPPVPVKPKAIAPMPAMIRAAARTYTPIRIEPDNKLVKQIHSIDELENSRIGPADLSGPPASGILPAGTVAGNGMVKEMTAPVREAVPDVYRTADRMPQFPGGQAALMRFLTRNLRMPEGAEAGTKVSVLATFVVGADGTVSRAEIGRSGGNAFDAEVRRVIAKMPVWIPGKMGDRNVAVYFTLPVQFVVSGE